LPTVPPGRGDTGVARCDTDSASRPSANRAHAIKPSRPDVATRLDYQLVAADNAQDQQWADLLAQQVPNVIKDAFMPGLVHRIENLDRAGFDAIALVRSAAAKGPLPDDHPAAALWWRILDELPPSPPSHSDQPMQAIPGRSASKVRQQPFRPGQGPRSTLSPGHGTHGPLR
jgi:hypothetical protein